MSLVQRSVALFLPLKKIEKKIKIEIFHAEPNIEVATQRVQGVSAEASTLTF